MEKVLVCQSCGMPIEKDEIIGTNADGSQNNDYCVYCFKDGKFTDSTSTLEEYIEYSLQFAEQAGITKEAVSYTHLTDVNRHETRSIATVSSRED